MNTTEYLSKWAISYKDDIINNIMPFWMKYGLDREHGGCIHALIVTVV